MTSDEGEWGTTEEYKSAIEVLKEAEPHLPSTSIP